MMSNEIVVHVIHALEQLDVPYMIVGSYSSNTYGQARSTQDADFVIELGAHSVAEIGRALGSEYTIDPQALVEFNTMTTRYVAQHVNSAFKIEFFILSDDAFDQSRFARRVRIPFLDGHAWLPRPEDVVVMKLRWGVRAGRQKDRLDAANVLAAQGGTLDMDYIRKWCDKHGSRQLLEEILTKIPQT
jgi:hypothetical protein